MSESLARLQGALLRSGEEIPDPGFKTCASWAEEWGISLASAQRKVGEFVRAGLMEMRVFRVKRGAKLFPVPHYREVEK